MLDYPINVTIDTNTFYACKYDLSKDSTLQILANYVRDGKVKVYLSNIVLKEAEVHLKKQGSDLCSLIRKNRAELLKRADESLINSAGLNEFLALPNKDSVKGIVCNRFDEYIKSLNPIVFDNSKIDLDAIVDDYFCINAPFENSEEKRKEFPDAFIANQIREEFPEDNSFIITKDKGFKRACLHGRDYSFLDCLGDLYNKISEQDQNYNLTITALAELKDSINAAIKENIIDYELITVYGLSHDRKGVVSGYDYSETMLRTIKNVSHKLHIVDDINEGEALITLACSADIEMDCFYEDYDNAPWDSEMKTYVYVDTKHIIEQHSARFGVRLRLDLNTKKYELNDVVIFLGEDTRNVREIVIDEDERKTIERIEIYNTCPDCGCGISYRNDGGNGFCTDCAPNH